MGGYNGKSQDIAALNETVLTQRLADIMKTCERYFYDVQLSHIAEWKKETPARKAVGCLPVYAPFELMIASGVRPVRVMGGGDQVDIIRGDSYYQSYICHLPRSVIELGLSGWKEALDGLICPAICDVIRNVSGLWKILFPEKLVYYLDLPHNFDRQCGGEFYHRELVELARRLCELSNTSFDAERYREAIRLYNHNRRVIRVLHQLRVQHPSWVPTTEYYLVLRAGDSMEVSEHTKLVEEYTAVVTELQRPELDNARILVIGAFCEQPPLNLIKTIERAGCYIVEDDFVLGPRWLESDVDETGDPIEALVTAYLEKSTYSSVRYEGDTPKTERLLQTVAQCRADGVLLMSPSFCDPSLFDRPHFQRALEEAGIPYTALQYAENLGQFQTIREQAGTFAEAIKLWGEA